jgi:hypothetical protein
MPLVEKLQMLTTQEKQFLVKTGSQLKHDIAVRLSVTDNETSGDFQKYCDVLTELIPKIRINKEKNTGNLAPVIEVGPSILIHALPQGTELSPFTELLLAVDDHSRISEGAPHEKNIPVEAPAMLKLYVSPRCPFCPIMMKQLFSRALVQPSLNLKVIDAALFPGLAADDAIQSVPTLILDNSFRWTGVVDMNEVRNAIRLRDPAKLGVDSLKSMIVNGDAFQLADMMIRAEKIFVSFVDLLVHEEFSTRLGAMAAAEELVEQRPDIARQLVDPLLNRFEDRIDQIKGDVLYIIGQAGDRRIIPFLNRILSGPYSVEVKEAAQEAVENLSAKT